jgi:nucleotide-binding universal stress UspA family protein
MTIKDILVHIDTSPSCGARIELAAALARRFNAFLIGAFILPSTELLELAADSATAVTLALNLAEIEENTATIEERFRRLLKREDLTGEWYTARGPAEICVTQRALTADLVILGQRDPKRPMILEAPEDVILACGRPVLVVPYAGRFDHLGDNALIAWNGRREASLAAHGALPLMAQANSVTVLSVGGAAKDTEERSEELIAHLARHGLNATMELIAKTKLTAAEMALSRVADLGADLMVMGAYGHSRLRETILGGMTRDILRHMTVPVLMAH